jgi:hypothetical protein
MILALICGTLSANTSKFTSKDWVVEVHRQFLIAETKNSSGHFFAQACLVDSGDCFYGMKNLGLRCRPDREFSASIKSNLGVLNTKLTCLDTESGAFSSFDEIDSMARKADYLEITVHVGKNERKISRFSLAGSEVAINVMRIATTKIMSKK